MRLCEFTKPSDYAFIEDEINDVLRQLEQIWKNAPRDAPKRQAGAKMVLTARDDGQRLE
jgi:hypothetical protein